MSDEQRCQCNKRLIREKEDAVQALRLYIDQNSLTNAHKSSLRDYGDLYSVFNLYGSTGLSKFYKAIITTYTSIYSLYIKSDTLKADNECIGISCKFCQKIVFSAVQVKEMAELIYFSNDCIPDFEKYLKNIFGNIRVE